MVDRIEYFAAQHAILFTLFFFVCGCGLYWVRERIRWLYAAAEMMFGIVAIYSAAPVIKGGDFSQAFDQFDFGGRPDVAIITVVAAVYLIVRGLDNWDKAMEKSPCWKRLRAKAGISRP